MSPPSLDVFSLGYLFLKTWIIAYVLQENAAMIHVFKKRYPNLKTSREGGDIEIHMDFDNAVES